MFTKKRLLFLIILVCIAIQPISWAQEAEPITVYWYAGIGTGTQPDQIEVERRIVAEFNAVHDEIELELWSVGGGVATDELRTILVSQSGLNMLIGPLGTQTANRFRELWGGEWLDLEPLAAAIDYDLSQFDPRLLDFYRSDGKGLLGLPFQVFPSYLIYNRELFDEAGLPYPPHQFGEPYADGDPWDVDKLREIGMLLTLDEQGYNATETGFDPTRIVQFGFAPQWVGNFRDWLAAPFGAGSFVGEDGRAVIPAHWREGAAWYHEGIWQSHFIPNADQIAQIEEEMDFNLFASGRIAMSITYVWYTCCIEERHNWDIAAIPSYRGEITTKLHEDSFRIPAGVENPEAVFEVLTYLIEAAPDLLPVFGGMSATAPLWDEYFARFDAKFPQGVDWQVAIDSLAYVAVPSHESDMPDYYRSTDRGSVLKDQIFAQPDIDLAVELDSLESDLQKLFDRH